MNINQIISKRSSGVWFFLCCCLLLMGCDQMSSKDSKTGIEWVTVAGGSFEMGCKSGRDNRGYDCRNTESPVRIMRVGSFRMSKYEVTNAQYARFLNAVGTDADYTGGKPKKYIDTNASYSRIRYQNGRFVVMSGYAKHPVVEVSWYGARAYAQWAGGRLPTEEEWEYAARGGDKSKGYQFAGSNTAGQVAWYSENSGKKTHPVGGKRPNELGLYDMSGNVLEWCESLWSDNYNSARNGGYTGSYRVLRGGSWYFDARHTRVSDRDYYSPAWTDGTYGFRLVAPL